MSETNKELVAQVVRERLINCHPGGVMLEVVEEDIQQVDGWWRVPVRPSVWPARMYEYYEALAEIEAEIQEERHLDILLSTGEPVSEQIPPEFATTSLTQPARVSTQRRRVSGRRFFLAPVPGYNGNISPLRGNIMTVIRWLGQACFLISTLMGTHILIDPPNPQVGYPIAAHSVPASIVFVSHEHPDHNYVQAAANIGGVAPSIIRPLPLTPDESVETGAYTYGPAGAEVDKVPFTRISAYHDDQGGRQRGPDTITVLQTGGLRIVHMGDIGELSLSADQVREIGRVDVLMIPVGGFFTVDGPQAAALVAQLKPRVILPMHYGTAALSPQLRSKLAPPAAFLAAMQGRAQVVHVRARDLKLSPQTLPKTPTIYLLRYQ